MKELGHGVGYQYAHNAEDGVVDQQHLPDGVDEKFYQPVQRGFERTLKERMDWLKQRKLDRGERR